MNLAQPEMEKVNFASDTQILKCNDHSFCSRAVNTCGHYLLLVLLLSFSLTLVTFGVVYFHQCEIANFIPLYLLTLGAYGIIEEIIYCVNKYKDNSELPTPTPWVLTRSFMIILFVWDSVQIYNLGTPNYDLSNGLHCDKTLYLFTYWMNTIAWIIIVLISFISCLLILIFNCKSWLFTRNQVIQI